MMATKTIIIICFICTLANCNVTLASNDVVDMLMGFMKLDHRPTSLLTPNLCWSRFTMTSMARQMNTAGINMAASMQRNRTEQCLHQVVILVDMSCPGSDKFLIQASKEEYFKAPHRWLLVDLESPGDQLHVLDDLEILTDSDVVVARRVSEQEFIFTEVYKINKTSETIHTTRAVWRPSTSNRHYAVLEDSNNTDIVLSDNRTSIKPRTTITVSKHGVIEDYRETKVLPLRRMNLRRHTLKIANVITDTNDTRNHLEDRLFLQHDSIAKLGYNVAKVCCDMLNASVKPLFTHTWGYRDKYGKWEGMIDYLDRKEADLGTLALFTLQRTELVDYIAMAGYTSVQFVFRQPPLPYVSNIYTLPFATNVWLAIVVCVLGCSVFLYITSKWEATVSMHQFQMSGSWADVLVLIMGAVLQQGCIHEPRFMAGRSAFFFLFIALTILYSAYAANIVVLLRAPSSSVRTLTDLLNSPLEVGASDLEYNRYFFKNLNDPVRKALYDQKIAPKGKKPHYYSMKEGIEKIRKGLFAFHMELNPGFRIIQETYNENEKCDLVIIDYFNEIDPWMPGQKKSPFKEFFKITFTKVRETGVQANIQHRLISPRPRCAGTIASFSSVGITDMYPALLATTYGMLLAPAVLLLEIAYHRLLRKRTRNNQLRNFLFTKIYQCTWETEVPSLFKKMYKISS